MGTEMILPVSCTTVPFRFYDLPAEVRIQIFEHTDLITPGREVRWDTATGYRAPMARRPSWCFPLALFLVNKDFYDNARKVFFGHNRIIVLHHLSVMGVRLAPPSSVSLSVLSDYAATIFFTSVLKPESLQYLRYLELPMFPEIYYDARETKQGNESRQSQREKARKNWFLALRRICNSAPGMLGNLCVLRIAGLSDNNPMHVDPATSITQDDNLNALRDFVKDRAWPMIDPEHGVPTLPRQLMVEIRQPQGVVSQYCIRKKGEKVYDESTGIRFSSLGRPAASRSVSWDPLRPGWDAAQDGEWIEETWGRNLMLARQRYSRNT
ncbi:hypothetical protein F5Y08DRAFT_308805 [Xylaria arbuscula]|nr:hypothetical protein F5Y08DRAFT_308805 [Xylaria arbuscula]